MGIRSIIAIAGDDRISFLQGIVTQDVTKLSAEKIQFAALLSPQGKILHDMFLIDDGTRILLDTQSEFKAILLKRLAMYKLRAKVVIEELSPEAVTSIPTNLPDPRHLELPPYAPFTTQDAPTSLGIPELGRDFMPDSVVALDAGYDLLNAVSFTKGCYVGQEITARMHYKNIARRGFFILTNDTMPTRLALLKFEDVEVANGLVTVDNQTSHARLPEWMAPKFVQYQSAAEKQ
jgi:folate-binding protein YgfZ